MWPRCASAARFAKPLHEARAFGFERALQHHGVGRDEVRRRERVDELLRREDEALLLGLRERGRCGELVQIFGWRAGSSASSARRYGSSFHSGAANRRSPGGASATTAIGRGSDRARAHRLRRPTAPPIASRILVEPASASACEKPAGWRSRRPSGASGVPFPVSREVRAGPPPRPVAGSRLPALGKIGRRMRLACRGRGHGAGLPGGERGGRARRNVRSRFIIRMTRVELR